VWFSGVVCSPPTPLNHFSAVLQHFLGIKVSCGCLYLPIAWAMATSKTESQSPFVKEVATSKAESQSPLGKVALEIVFTG